jgi:hypothetical protein
VTDREVAESVPGASPLDRKRNIRIPRAGGQTDLHRVRARSQTSRVNRCDVSARAGEKAFH